MKTLNRYSLLAVLLLIISATDLYGQIVKPDTSDLTFTGTYITSYTDSHDTTGKITLSGYIDTYYAGYTDTANADGFQKFPTAAPRSGQFGLNIVQVSAKYQSSRFRGVTTLFFGDTPQSSWSPYLNMIQEANIGFHIAKNIWLDAGYFRTHIGLESIQPRENMAISFASTTYFEPYFLSGAKLTWEATKKLTLQINAFNSYNSFIENNKNKAVGVSFVYAPTEKWNINFNNLTSDDSPTYSALKKTRNYSDLNIIYKSHRVTIGFEANYGIQANSKLTDSTKSATMFSSLFAAKYRLTAKYAIYARGEIFRDPNEILTGPVKNNNHKFVGIDLTGFTCGVEYKPIPNSYFRIEGRVLETGTNEKIFYYNNQSTNIRYEFIIGLGLWF